MPGYSRSLWIQRQKHNSCTLKSRNHRQVNEDSYSFYLTSASHPCICLLKFYPFKVNPKQQAFFISMLEVISLTPLHSPEHFFCPAIRTLNPDYLNVPVDMSVSLTDELLSSRDYKDLYFIRKYFT